MDVVEASSAAWRSWRSASGSTIGRTATRASSTSAANPSRKSSRNTAGSRSTCRACSTAPAACCGTGPTHKGNLLHTLKDSVGSPSWWYGFIYSVVVVVFGVRRIRRRKTPYVRWQTCTLMAIQVVPLFLLPDLLLPWMGANGWFDPGHPLAWIADQLIRPRPRVLARHRVRARVAVAGLQRLHRATQLRLAGDLVRADLRADSVSSSGAGAREPIAAGSAPAARWRKPSATSTAARCRTAPVGTG